MKMWGRNTVLAESKRRIGFGKRMMIQFLNIFLVTFLLLMLFFMFLNRGYRNAMEESAKDISNIYISTIENLTEIAERDVKNIVSNGRQSQVIQYGKSDLAKYEAAQTMMDMLSQQMALQNGIGGFILKYNGNENIYYKLDDTITFGVKEQFLSYIKKADENPECLRKWNLLTAEDHSYLIYICNLRRVSLAVLVNYEVVIESLSERYKDSYSTVLAGNEEEIMYGRAQAQELKITELASIRQTERIGRSFVIKQEVGDTGLFLVHAFSYENSNEWTAAMYLFLLILVVLVLIWTFSYRFVNKSLVEPLNAINDTICDTIEGNLKSRVNTETRILEYANIGQSFNQMMDRIGELRIQVYEEKLKEQNTKLQYLQLQIKPHFYLNRFKAFYALLKQQKYKQLETSILSTSRYFRYIFRNHAEEVTLQEELEFTHNFISIRQEESNFLIELVTEIDPEILKCRGIPLCIQTFVENSIKYADAKDLLMITVHAEMLVGEEECYMDIIVSDNGVGYPEAVLERINAKNSEDRIQENAGYNVGILNLKKRLKLQYGEKAELACRNNRGAVSELLYPILEE